MNNNNYQEDYVNEEKKFRITRGMVILAAIAAVVLIIIIIIIAHIIKSLKPAYTREDFERLELRMREEAPMYLSQKKIELTTDVIKINLKDLLIQGEGSIDPSKVKAANVCEGYVNAYKNEVAVYEPFIKCDKYYTTNGYEEIKKTTTTKEKDKEKPVINIIGEKEITIEEGTEYKDEGATASDNYDGDITSKIKVSNSLDTTKVGEYKLIYTVLDKAGNKAEETRIIRVVEKKTTAAPTTTARATTKKVNTTRATARVTTKITTPPTITLIGNSTISINLGQKYSDPGYSAKDAKGKDLTAKVKVTGSVNYNVAGTYTTKYEVWDAYGNYATKTRTIYVINSYIKLERITLTPNSVTLNVGSTQNLTVGYTPTNASNKNISWSSSNTAVATISNGEVRAMSKGTAYITARGADNKSAQITVVVK